MTETSPAEEAFAELLDALSAIDRESLEALDNARLAEQAAMRRRALWTRCFQIGLRLKSLGGLDLMHSAVERARRRSPRMSDQLEESWSAIPGYQKRRFLP